VHPPTLASDLVGLRQAVHSRPLVAGLIGVGPLSRFKRLVFRRLRASLTKAALKPWRFRLLATLLEEPRLRARLEHRWSNQQSFSAAWPADIGRVEDFADVTWLFTSSMLNHGLARQELSEAAYLWRLVRGHVTDVAEIGRYRGGTTFLFAAAGAHVVSIDRREPMPGSDADLLNALERAGLDDRVELVNADIREYVPGRTFGLVLFDIQSPYDVVAFGLERWWQAVAPGGSLIIRDGSGYPPQDPRAAIVSPAVAAAAAMASRSDAEVVEKVPGSYMHLRRVPEVATASHASLNEPSLP
jgi:SAM-dependent methyltransferase